MRLSPLFGAALLVVISTVNAAEREIKSAQASDENRAVACSNAGKQLQNNVSVQTGVQKLVSLGNCDCSKDPDGPVSKGRWMCAVNGTFEDK
ncbi:hypothetical protein VUJ49_03215 [Pseudomonas berkeleyensis]|uniref:Uncharacterized protein n=1 Tax=Pseudomonas berkeleyensis TaxID=2726956 RepID=A0A7G5DQR5_9PSED|nr:hypothetical protein [Pseudomonas berkeleyensis]QMV64090.1 hypothetical protein HS968_03205 [Pseudomonas berkeleyensis]WSO39557.1 hypothetical protein VUJ49_03215 [Pseudomonas berkeleyensis]